MAYFRVTGAFLDWSGPEDFNGGACGCAFEIGGNFIPVGVGPNNTGPHAVCYPLEASALYLLKAHGSTGTRYIFRHFVLEYPSGAVVVGWYHDRIMDILPRDMNMNDIEIFSKDSKINMSHPALYAKTPEGRFITGPVWLGAFNPHDRVHLGPQWNETPNSVIHGFGWYVPSWVFEPEKRHGLVVSYKTHRLPEDGSTSGPTKPPVKRVAPKPQVTPPRKKYLAIQPKPQDGFEEHKSVDTIEEAKRLWKENSASRLVHKQDQEDVHMPTYTDLSFLTKI